MGYRSDWKLTIGVGKDKDFGKVEQLLTWMRYISKSGNDDLSGTLSRSGLFKFILDNEDERDGSKITFSDEHCKCYDPWDDIVHDITTKAEELGLVWAYARVGEEFEDVVRNGNGMYMYIDRLISGAEFD